MVEINSETSDNIADASTSSQVRLSFGKSIEITMIFEKGRGIFMVKSYDDMLSIFVQFLAGNSDNVTTKRNQRLFRVQCHLCCFWTIVRARRYFKISFYDFFLRGRLISSIVNNGFDLFRNQIRTSGTLQ